MTPGRKCNEGKTYCIKTTKNIKHLGIILRSMWDLDFKKEHHWKSQNKIWKKLKRCFRFYIGSLITLRCYFLIPVQIPIVVFFYVEKMIIQFKWKIFKHSKNNQGVKSNEEELSLPNIKW